MIEVKKPVDVREQQQEYYEEITERLEKYSEADQNFMLWWLMQGYINRLQEDLETYDSPKNVEEWLKYDFAKKHQQAAREIREVLYYSVF